MSDYEEFVKRMGSFDMELSLDDVGPNKDTLQHHGIKGMKWGVRRSRNPSGGSTNTKPKRNWSQANLRNAKGGLDSAANLTREANKINKSIYNIKKTSKKPDISKMSDKELKEIVARMNLEQQYDNLSNNYVSNGQAYTREVLEIAGSALAIGSSVLGIALAIKQLKQ